LTEEHGFNIVRVFDAPRQRVWEEWTEPERFADWFGGADAEVPIASVTMDVRDGGTWSATMFAGGRTIQWRGEYREVVPPERLVLTMTDQPEGDERELITVVLRDLGGRTEMQFDQRGGLSPEQYEHAGSGWGGFFDRIVARLAA
jgi:uncharacterized protein YndB with AHSA1/START domain